MDTPKINIPGSNDLEVAKAAAKKLEELGLEDKLKEAQSTIDSLTKAITEKDEAIKILQDTNQRLYLRVAQPVETETQQVATDPLVQSALDKINKYNEALEASERNTDGSNQQ